MTRMFASALFVFALAAGSAHAAARLEIPDVVPPAIPLRAPSAAGFVPRGWTVESRIDGAVNEDGRPDIVLLLRDADPRNIVDNDGLGVDRLDTNPRVLLVLLAQPTGGFRRVGLSDALIRRTDNPVLSDPLDEGGIELARRVLSIRLGFFSSAGSWSMGSATYRFRWQDGCMRFIGYDDNNVQRNSGETTQVSINLLTRQATRTTGNIEDERTRTHRWRVAAAQKCLDDVTDGDITVLTAR